MSACGSHAKKVGPTGRSFMDLDGVGQTEEVTGAASDDSSLAVGLPLHVD